jgi:hypothetical protein
MTIRKINITPSHYKGYEIYLTTKSFIPYDIIQQVKSLPETTKDFPSYDAWFKRYFELMSKCIIDKYHCHDCDLKEPHFKRKFKANNCEAIVKLLNGVKSMPIIWIKEYWEKRPISEAGLGYTALESMDIINGMVEGINNCFKHIKGDFNEDAILYAEPEDIFLLYIYSTFEHFGKKRYFATKELTQELANTVFEDIEVGDIHFPNTAFCVYFEKGGFTYTDKDGNVLELIAGYMTEDLDVRLIPPENKIPEEGKDYVTGRSWNLILELQNKDGHTSYIPFQRRAFVSEKLSAVFNNVTVTEDIAAKEAHYLKMQHVQAFNLIINTILYITNSEEFRYTQDINEEYEVLKKRMLVAKGGKREKIKEQMRRKGANPVVVMGSSYIIDRTKQPISKIQTENVKYHIKVRTLVSGHWRKQPYGKDNLHRKLLWIKPFWRGPKDAPISRSMGILK